MARPLRVEFPGAVYHVASRGNARKSIYLSENILLNRQLIIQNIFFSFVIPAKEAVSQLNFIDTFYTILNYIDML